jgi:hypothetical protein
MESIMTIKYYPHDDCIKGEAPLSENSILYKSSLKKPHKEKGTKSRWTLPPIEVGKLNVYGSFSIETRSCGVGMVLRDGQGEIVFSAHGMLQNNSSPLEAELIACLEGCSLALLWSTSPFIIEMDCAEAVGMINSFKEERSPFTFLVKEGKQLLAVRVDSKLEFIRRELNLLIHTLASLGLSGPTI